MIKLNIRSGKSTTSTPKVSPKAVQAKKQLMWKILMAV